MTFQTSIPSTECTSLQNPLHIHLRFISIPTEAEIKGDVMRQIAKAPCTGLEQRVNSSMTVSCHMPPKTIPMTREPSYDGHVEKISQVTLGSLIAESKGGLDGTDSSLTSDMVGAQTLLVWGLARHAMHPYATSVSLSHGQRFNCCRLSSTPAYLVSENPPKKELTSLVDGSNCDGAGTTLRIFEDRADVLVILSTLANLCWNPFPWTTKLRGLSVILSSRICSVTPTISC